MLRIIRSYWRILGLILFSLHNERTFKLKIYLRSTETVHSVTKAAIAPTAANTGANTAPTIPMVNGMLINTFPFLSLMLIFLTLPS